MGTDDEHVLAPALIGLEVTDAHALALDARVVTVNDDPDTPPPLAGTVVAQHPQAGTQVRPGDAIQILVEADGGDGGLGVAEGPGPLDTAGGRPLDPA